MCPPSSGWGGGQQPGLGVTGAGDSDRLCLSLPEEGGGLQQHGADLHHRAVPLPLSGESSSCPLHRPAPRGWHCTGVRTWGQAQRHFGDAHIPRRAGWNWAALLKGRWEASPSFIPQLSVPWLMLEGCSLPAARSAPSPAARPRWHPSTPKVREGSGKSRGRGLIYNLPVMVPRAPWGPRTPARLVLCTGCPRAPAAL